jgi:hypothetical protein
MIPNPPWHDYLAAGLAALGVIILVLYFITQARRRHSSEEYAYEQEGFLSDDASWAAAIRDQLRSPGRFRPSQPLWRDEPAREPAGETADWATTTLVGFGRWRSDLEAELRDWRRELVTQLPD